MGYIIYIYGINYGYMDIWIYVSMVIMVKFYYSIMD